MKIIFSSNISEENIYLIFLKASRSNLILYFVLAKNFYSLGKAS